MVAPVIALALWTHLIWAWMYATRLPAMRKGRMKPDSFAPRGEQMSQLPPEVRWKADNYNHLMEQPTVFYAVALSLAVLQDTTTITLALCWTYVLLRIAHSLVQTTINKIEVRFAFFALSSFVLIAMTIRAALLAF